MASKITEQGSIVRNLKADPNHSAVSFSSFLDDEIPCLALQDALASAIKDLLKLKEDYKSATGKEWTNPGSTRQPKKPAKVKPKMSETSKQSKKQSRLGIEFSKADQLSEWYSEVITKSELITYYDVSGCYILRPWAYSIWESIQVRRFSTTKRKYSSKCCLLLQKWFDAEIKKLGVENAYFPIFVSQAALEREKDHIQDFAPEVRFWRQNILREMLFLCCCFWRETKF